MIKEFVEGEIYSNPKKYPKTHVMVLGVFETTPEQTTLAVLFIDPETFESTKDGELTVKASELGDWNEVEL